MRTKRIPVIKSRVVLQESRPRSRLKVFAIIVLSLVLMLFQVWLHVQINVYLSEVERLEAENKQIKDVNQKLEAEVVELSNYGRINKIAQELGLRSVPNEEIVPSAK